MPLPLSSGRIRPSMPPSVALFLCGNPSFVGVTLCSIMASLLEPESVSSTGIVASLFAILVFVVVLRQVRLWYRLRHIPGPRLARWSVVWQLAGALSGRYDLWLKEASDNYGRLPTLLPPFLSKSPLKEAINMLTTNEARWYASAPTSCSLPTRKSSVVCLQYAALIQRATSTTAEGLSRGSTTSSRQGTRSNTKP